MSEKRHLPVLLENLFHLNIVVLVGVSSFLNPGLMGFSFCCSLVGMGFLKKMIGVEDLNITQRAEIVSNTKVLIAGEVFSREKNSECEDERVMRIGGFSKILKRKILVGIVSGILAVFAFRMNLQPYFVVYASIATLLVLGYMHVKDMLLIPIAFHLIIALAHIDHWLTLSLFVFLALPLFLTFCRILKISDPHNFIGHVKKILQDYIITLSFGLGCHLLVPMQINNYVPTGLFAKTLYKGCQKLGSQLEAKLEGQRDQRAASLDHQSDLDLTSLSFEEQKKALENLSSQLKEIAPLINQLSLNGSQLDLQGGQAGTGLGMGSTKLSGADLKSLENQLNELGEQMQVLKMNLEQGQISQTEFAASLDNIQKETQETLEKLQSLESNFASDGQLAKEQQQILSEINRKVEDISQAQSYETPPVPEQEALPAPDKKGRWKKFKTIGIVLVLIFLLDKIAQYRKKEEDDLPIGEDRRKVNALKAQLKKLFSRRNPPEKQIIESYNLWRELCQDWHFEADEVVPPADIMARRLNRPFPALKKEIHLTTQLFNQVFYGKYGVSKKDFKEYYRSFKKIIGHTLKKS